MNLAEVVTQHAAARPEGVALVQPAEPGRERLTLSWRELDQAVTNAAQLLAEWGLRAPQRVLLHAENSAAVVVAYLACQRAGLVATPINPQSTAAELTALVESTGASLLLSDTEPAELSTGLVAGLPAEAATALGVRPLADVLALTATEPTPLAAPVDPESLAVLIQTSGSVSAPRAVMLSQRALSAHRRQSAASGRVRPDDVVLALLPLFHVFGLNAVLGVAVHVGATTVLTAGMRPDLIEVVEAERVSQLPVTPTVMSRLLQLPRVGTGLHGVRRVSCGAAPLSTALAREFTRVTGVAVEQGYGLTEAAPGVAVTGTEEIEPLVSGTHVGSPLPGVEVRIGSGREESEPGEIHIRGENLFSGYWPDGRGGPDADGWFATGDLGYRSAGQLYLVGRLREVVIVSGFNVYPTEVEEALLEHPAVHAAAVIGHADEQTGESLVAFVSVVPGRRGLSVGALQRHCEQRLARYKCPGEIYVLERMPRSITGKIRKGELRILVDALEEEQ